MRCILALQSVRSAAHTRSGASARPPRIIATRRWKWFCAGLIFIGVWLLIFPNQHLRCNLKISPATSASRNLGRFLTDFQSKKNSPARFAIPAGVADCKLLSQCGRHSVHLWLITVNKLEKYGCGHFGPPDKPVACAIMVWLSQYV